MIVKPFEPDNEQAIQALKRSLIDIPDGKGGTQKLALLIKAQTSEEERIANIKANIKRKAIRFTDLPGLLRQRGEPIAIVAGGPSVSDYLDEIRKFRHIMAAGSAYKYLIDNGVVPNFAVLVDPLPDALKYYQNPHKDTSFLVASQCDPETFDLLEGHKVAMWHFRDQVPNENFNGEKAINWGCMVSINCITMAFYLGFQEHHYFGVDCSMTKDKTHAYDVTEKKWVQEQMQIAEVGPEKNKFWTTPGLICQAEHFIEMFASADGKFLKGYVYGPGLLADVIRQTDMRPWLEAA